MTWIVTPLAPFTALVAGAFLASAPVAAQTYPSQTVSVVVPFPPGGGTDFIARLITDQLSQRFPQPVIIDNRPGAATIIGTEHVRHSAADGHTILMATNSLVSNEVMSPEASYDIDRDFELVTLLGVSPNLMTVGTQSPYTDLQSILDAALADPEAVSFVSYGPASAQVFSFFEINRQMGAELVDIPYQGHSNAFAAILSNEVDILFPSITATLPGVQGGQLRPIALASDVRSPLLPEVPTFMELGITLEAGTWYGFLVPKGTPAEVISALHTEVAEVLAMDEVREPLEAQGLLIRAWDGERFGEMVAEQRASWVAFRDASAE
ncbi:MAG: Bug family tripartite tricarboxylate transporter substrate binding protein [Pararhodobacter sp.]